MSTRKVLNQKLSVSKMDIGCFLGPDYMSRASPVSRAGPVCRDLSTPIKRNKNQLSDYMTTRPARLAKIPVSRCREPG